MIAREDDGFLEHGRAVLLVEFSLRGTNINLVSTPTAESNRGAPNPRHDFESFSLKELPFSCNAFSSGYPPPFALSRRSRSVLSFLIADISPTERNANAIAADDRRTASSSARQSGAKIKAGEITAADALAKRDDPIVGKIKVAQFLQSFPGWGKVRAAKLMEEAGIQENRRLAGLGERQVEKLVEALS